MNNLNTKKIQGKRYLENQRKRANSEKSFATIRS